MIKVSAFRWVPPFAQGLVRDLRVRWALEEAGLPYEELLIGQADQSSPTYRALQPFGQVPACRDGDLAFFESGAIVLHIAEKSDPLMPSDPDARARAITWMFAELNTIEPPIQNLAEIDIFNADKAWAKERRPDVVQRIRVRLGELAGCLDGRDYLEHRFTGGDLMMSTVLRNLRHTDLVAEKPALAAYLARCEARPAFARALDAQLAAFAANPPPAAA